MVDFEIVLINFYHFSISGKEVNGLVVALVFFFSFNVKVMRLVPRCDH